MVCPGVCRYGGGWVQMGDAAAEHLLGQAGHQGLQDLMYEVGGDQGARRKGHHVHVQCYHRALQMRVGNRTTALAFA